MDNENKELTKMAKYRGKLKDLFKNDYSAKTRAGASSKIEKLSDVLTKDAATLYKEALTKPETAYKLSEAAYYASNQYSAIIDYYKTFFFIRYTVVPYRLEDKTKETITKIGADASKIGQESEEYGKIYSRMIGAVEGINLETLIPNIIEKTMIYGSCGVVTEKHTASETITTYMLPQGYYKSVGKTQFGTDIVAFNFEYIDGLKKNFNGGTNSVKDTTFEETVLSGLPKILQKGYKEYQTDTTRKWIVLDPKCATMFTFNDLALPPKLGAFQAAVDYNNYKALELSSKDQGLDKIIAHQIPTNADGDLIMEVDEAIDIAAELRNALSSIERLKIITTFGPTQLLDLSGSRKEQMDSISTAYNNIYNSAAVDYHVFVSDDDIAASLKRDKAFIWDFLQPVILFYNISVNNLLNFKPYQAKINLLPISVQSEDEDVHRYIEYAGAGIGRLQAVVATGLKQVDLASVAEVEEFLKLDDILTPLQSMYTSSYRVNQNIQEKQDKNNTQPSDTEKEEDKIVDVDIDADDNDDNID